MNAVGRSNETAFATGVIPAAGYIVVATVAHPLPCTLSLTSTLAGRKIEISTDGTNFTNPTPDASETAFLALGIRAPIAAVKFTGTAADAWSIL
jgi:hypothetical protein